MEMYRGYLKLYKRHTGTMWWLYRDVQSLSWGYIVCVYIYICI